MITLKEFIKTTLQEIADALEEFEVENAGKDASVKPATSLRGDLAGTAASAAGLLYLGKAVGYATVVNFDVAIASEDNKSTKAEGGIKVLPFRAEAGTDFDNKNSTVSRIQFPLPLRIVSHQSQNG